MRSLVITVNPRNFSIVHIQACLQISAMHSKLYARESTTLTHSIIIFTFAKIKNAYSFIYVVDVVIFHLVGKLHEKHYRFLLLQFQCGIDIGLFIHNFTKLCNV